MRNNQPVTNIELNFSEDEILSSTTDLEGHITSASPAFVKLSGFSEQELMGQPHNIVRHPDMPEEAYEWLWRTIAAGKTWRGLVKNRSKQGDFYWVEANASPVYTDGKIVGYRSLRYKPSRQEVDEAAKLYAGIKSGRIKNPFRPKKLDTMLNNIKLWQKFVALIVLAIVMFAVPTYFMVGRNIEDKNFALKEKQGVDYATETIKLMQLVVDHRGLNAMVIAGNGQESGRRETKREEISRQIANISAVDGRFSELGLTLAWRAMQDKWQALVASANGFDAQTNIAKHAEFIAQLHAFNRKVADASGLTLDPEVNTYYAQALAINLFPDLSEQLGMLRGIGSPILLRKTVTPAEASYLRELISNTEETLELIDEDIAKLGNLDDATRSALQKSSAEAKKVITVAESEILQATKLEMSGTDFFNALTAAIQQNFSLSASFGQLLHDGLDARVARLDGDINATLLVLSLCFLGFLSMSWYIVMGVLRPVKSMINAMTLLGRGEMPPRDDNNYGLEFNQLNEGIKAAVFSVQSLIADASMLSQAAVEGKLSTRADAGKHQGDFRKIVQGVNNTLDAVIGPLNVAADYVDKISRGAIPAKITDSYNGDFNVIKNNLNTCIDAVNALVADANLLAQAAVEGKLSTRADASKHQGDFRKVVEGVNHTLDAVIGPLNVAADYVDNISKGAIPAKISDHYNGDFNTIKNNLNNCIDAISNMVAEAAALEKAAIEGRLATRADASQYQGDYRKIVQGVNNTLDAVIGPLNVAADYVDKISRGAIPAKITDSYNGDFNVIKNNLNTCIDAVNALVADANLLAQAAVEGKLSTRADATKHQGDFRKVVEGVNHTLDAVIGPLNVAADYVDNISKGAIPAKISDHYNGDFNTIKNNLNNCIDAISNMVAEAAALEKAAIEGRLATRADASQYQGDYRKIVQGVNNTLDAVIGPLNVAADYVDKISRGAIPAKITDSYNGDFNVIKNNLNTCIDAVNALVADANLLAQAAVEGKLSTRADASKHQGDFRKVVEGVNHTLDAVIGPLNVAADYVDNISKGAIPAKISDHYNGDFNTIKNNLNNCIDAISNMVAEAAALEKAAIEGRLATRADASQYQGDYRKIVQGVNNTLDAVIGPLNVAADYVDKISRGAIPAKITDSYNGDFNVIKNNLNTCIDAVNALVADANLLAQAAVEGKLSTRADASKHQGDFRKVVEGVNHTLDAVIGPLNVAADYVDNISKGAIPAKISDHYNGDFNTIKNNLNNCIDAISNMVAEAAALEKAAIEGRLATRADASQYQGDYRKIVQGVNNTLDAVIGPLNVAADYVDKISRGAIPAKITDSYNGDFNVIKNNLNTCIDAVNALVADANLLAQAAVEGKLSTRADASKHQGDFRKIVQGVNETLDGVILPLNEAVEVLSLVEQGDLTRTVNGDYKGQLSDFKDTVNNTIANLSKTIGDVIIAADQLTNAAEQISSTSQSLSQAASEQAASVEETSASIEEMAASINQNAENAKVTDGMAGKASKEAVEGGGAVKQTVDAMKEIAAKIGIIDDIAYQTNMLALNAAIEAARAGDHGKGFAVVAAEVRKLAERSQVAAQEIGELADSSVKTAETAGKLLDEIVPSIAKTSDLVQEIAAASQEQSAGVSQVNNAMNQMNQITQQNASASEQLAATAEEMTGQSEQLQTLMAFFKIGHGNSSGSRSSAKASRRVAKVKPVSSPASHDEGEAEFDLSQFERF
ncbi:methyl-accepting chemotaxis protein [Methylomonas sp. EFPC3]|nr:methyl-accepting chemotaxis protein [Methylomonas sp. EFPC3]WFP49103.1 methyl-accepting chemotaxis protein [Methylomonas sp. EFPC3]